MAIDLEYSAVAQCRPEHCWQVFQNLNEWSGWLDAVGQARWIEGAPWQKGSRFEFHLSQPRPATITPTITDIEIPYKVIWVGKGMGVTGEHAFVFAPQADGTTRITTMQRYSGAATMFAPKHLIGIVQSVLERWVERLKLEAEALARRESGPHPEVSVG